MTAANQEDLAPKMEHLDDARAQVFWTEYCADLEAPIFPPVPFSDYTPRARGVVEHCVGDIAWPGEDITSATTLRTAWAALQAQWTGVDDVVFGVTSSGRQTDAVRVDRVGGPTTAVAPARVRLDRSMTVQSILLQVQQQAFTTVPYEQMELARIQSLGNDTRQACAFQTLLLIQRGQTLEWDKFTTYGLIVQCELHISAVQLRLVYDEQILETAMVRRMTQQFEHILRQLCASQHQTIPLADVDLVSLQDRADIWQWNATVPEAVDACVHELIAETVQRQPEALAISAWDGELTYRELEELSTRLAYHLSVLSVELGTIVPLCFEKSMWTTVAMLGVMKAGGAFTLLDSSLPVQRLDTMIRAVSPPVVVCSPRSRQRLSSCELQIFELHSTALLTTASQWPKGQPTIDSSSSICVAFTSGSSGTPKAAILRHSNIATAHFVLKDRLGFGPNERVYDFSSYAFDVSMGNTLQALLSGACLCVPSDVERQNDLVESLAQRKPTIVCLTTSVLRTLPQNISAGLTRLLFGAEPLLPIDIELWAGAGNAVHVYGQAECTVMNVIHPLRKDNKAGDIGRGVGASTWCIGEKGTPAPIGMAGELWLEGPLVGAGYLNDKQTAAAFIDDPPWLLAGGPSVRGRRGRLYKTGDLVRYRPDGSLQFVGRKDGQVKIRGQRLELSEVEQHVRDALVFSAGEQQKLRVPLVAEVVTPRGGQPALVVFASAFGQQDEPSVDSKNEFGASERGSEPFIKLAQLVARLDERLAVTVPIYMIPTAYVALQSIPLTASGKTNRRRLREMVSSWTVEELAQHNAARATSRRAPSTQVELQLQRLWAQVLHINPYSIAADDSFLLIGGDSLQAMQLAKAAGEHQLHLTVADVFAQPSLSGMAALLSQKGPPDDSTVAPFALLPSRIDGDVLISQVLAAKGPADQIQDAYPVTSMQDTFVQGAQLQPPLVCFVFYLDLPSSNNVDDAYACCDALWACFDIFRAVFVRYMDQFWTLIRHGRAPSPIDLFEQDSDLDRSSYDIFRRALEQPMQMGLSHTKFLIVRVPGEPVRLGMRLCHAQYDGVSYQYLVNIVGRTLTDRRQGRPACKPQPPFAAYIRHAQQHEASSLLYWSKVLEGSVPLPFFSAKLRSNPLPADLGAAELLLVQQKVRIASHHSTGVSTPATRFAAACAMAFSRITGVADVVFGMFVNGRASLPADLLSVFGPCLAIVPVRLSLCPDQTLDDATAGLHRHRTESLAFESSTFVDTLQECTDWPVERRRYSSLVIYQDIDEEPSYSNDELRLRTYSNLRRRPGLALVVSAVPVQGHLEISVTGRTDFYEQHELEVVLNAISTLLSEVREK